jgi:hypothetical protein
MDAGLFRATDLKSKKFTGSHAVHIKAAINSGAVERVPDSPRYRWLNTGVGVSESLIDLTFEKYVELKQIESAGTKAKKLETAETVTQPETQTSSQAELDIAVTEEPPKPIDSNVYDMNKARAENFKTMLTNQQAMFGCMQRLMSNLVSISEAIGVELPYKSIKGNKG